MAVHHCHLKLMEIGRGVLQHPKHPPLNPPLHHEETNVYILIQTLTLTSSMKKSVTGKINFCTLAGDRQNIHFENNSQRKAPSAPGVSPANCCKRRSNCVGLRSPNSSELNNCCRRFCSDAAVLLTSCSVSGCRKEFLLGVKGSDHEFRLPLLVKAKRSRNQTWSFDW